MKLGFRLLIAVGIITGTAHASHDPFIGKWKLDSSLSQLPGDTMKVELVTGNRYTFIFSDPRSETIVTDGTDQPGIDGTTLAVTAQRPRAWVVVRKKAGGSMILRAIWTLSDDGKTLRDLFTAYLPDGPPFTVDYLYQRKTAGSGFAATWESIHEVYVSPYIIQIQPYQEDGFLLIDPVAGVDKNLKLDGKDHPNSGPNASPDMLSSGRRIGNRKLEVTNKLKDKLFSTDDFELSPDLQTLTETQHFPDQSKPVILVFKLEQYLQHY